MLTGQFRRLRLPVLRNHILDCASDSLLMLGDRDETSHLACILNPMTGDMLHFAASLRKPLANIWSTAVTGGSCSRLVLRAYVMVAWAAPTSDEFIEEDIGKSTYTQPGLKGGWL